MSFPCTPAFLRLAKFGETVLPLTLGQLPSPQDGLKQVPECPTQPALSHTALKKALSVSVCFLPQDF